MCKALEDLYEDGMAKGIEKGREKGIEEGINRGQQIVVRNMLTRGMNDADILALAECDQSLIDRIRREL